MHPVFITCGRQERISVVFFGYTESFMDNRT